MSSNSYIGDFKSILPTRVGDWSYNLSKILVSKYE